MRRKFTQSILAAALVAMGLGSAASLHAAPIITITSSTSGSRVDLSTLTIDRDGAGSLASLTYDHSDLIGVSVTGYNSENASTVAIPTGASVPAVGSRATLMTDLGLNTGLINLEDAPGAGADPGLRFIFNSPIVNSAGIDVVFIEVQSTTAGSVPDPFWVKVTGDSTEKSYSNTNGDYSAKLRDVSFDVFGSGSAINTLADLENATITAKVTTVTQGIYAVGIDLSDLGVADGATVTSLDFRSGSSGNAVDPVFIAGLPAVPEPAGLSLLGLSALALRRTRRA